MSSASTRRHAAKIENIKRLRPLVLHASHGASSSSSSSQRNSPSWRCAAFLARWRFKKRASANSAERTAWAKDDLLFVSNYGVGDERQISFAHFSMPTNGHDLPTLKVLGWDNRDTAVAPRHRCHANSPSTWPGPRTTSDDPNAWREQLARRIHASPP